MSTTDPVSEARELLAAATPGPWSLRPYADEVYGNLDVACDSIVAGETPVLKQLGCGCCDIGLEGRVADAELIAAAPRLLAELADEVERLRAEPTEAEIAAAAEAITAHSTLSHPCEGGERCCDECGEAFGWHGIDRTEEDHRYAIHRARKALAALRAVLAQHHLHDCSPEHGSWCSPCWSEGLCEGCSEDWPCPTVKTIAKALGGG